LVRTLPNDLSCEGPPQEMQCKEPEHESAFVQACGPDEKGKSFSG
jgi:hypothetical protein